MKYLSNALIALVIVITITSCNDEIENLQVEPNQSSLLVFENEDDFNQAVSESVQIPESELEVWAQSKGINSFGVEAVKRYNSINFEELSNKEELMSIIEQNKGYLVLEEIENELYLETKYHDKANRFLINQDRLVQIGEKVHKIFNNGELKASLDKIESLKAISEQQFNQLISSTNQVPNEFEIISTKSNVNTSVNRSSNWGTMQERRSTSNRDRTLSKAELKTKKTIYGHVQHDITFLVRPYKKTLGVWYHCTRTITGEANFTVMAESQNGNPFPFSYSFPRTTISSSKWERSYSRSINDSDNDDGYFDKVAMYGDTPSTPPAEFDLN